MNHRLLDLAGAGFWKRQAAHLKALDTRPLRVISPVDLKKDYMQITCKSPEAFRNPISPITTGCRTEATLPGRRGNRYQNRGNRRFLVKGLIR